MPRELSPKTTQLLDIIERLDRAEYERIVGPAFKQLTDEDLAFLSTQTRAEKTRRYAQTTEPLSSQDWQPLIT